jgi:hypothetical protein
MIKRKMVGRGGRIGSVLPRSDVAGGCWGFRFRQNDISLDYTIVHRTLKPAKNQIFSELLERLTEQAAKLMGRERMMMGEGSIKGGQRGLKETRTECHKPVCYLLT